MDQVNLQPSRWTDADFESLTWHDCTIHSMGLEQDGEYQSDLLLDLDFLLDWLLTSAGKFQFRIAPALLRFQNVDRLAIHTLLSFKQPMQIQEITRSRREDPGYANYHWTIELQGYPGRENRIEFDATGFSQELTAKPAVTNRQVLRLAERREMIRASGEKGDTANDVPASPSSGSGVQQGPPSGI